MLFAAQGGSWITIVLMVLVVGVMFFFMFRSQKKQEKEANDMRNNLQIGDEVTTIGGIIGEIVRIKEETVTIETGKDRTKIRILRSAIRTVDVHAADKYGTPAPAPAETETKAVKVKASKKKKGEKSPEATTEAPVEVTEVNEAAETESK
ncbi:MAG: preprotein translocase subunit YajC [Clostridia bacterium]|nr:preprotein translocase subunit YajC [Clostridia bacterium]